MRKLVVALCLIMLLGGCTQHAALEPQTRAADARQARLYFIRHSEVLGLGPMGGADIKIDGKPVGTLAPGTYIVLDRPPGKHTISASNTIIPSDTDSDVQLEAGISYYFELGPIVIRNIDLFKLQTMGIQGRLVPGRIGAAAAFMFYTLDASAGAAAVAKLKPAGA